MSQLIEKSFKESPTASDYDYELDAINGFIAAVHPKGKNQIITDSEFRILEERFGKFAANAEKPHSGLIENSKWAMITSKNKVIEDKPKAILYTGIVSSQLPLRISKMLSEIEAEERDLESKREQRGNRPVIDLSGYKDVKKRETPVLSKGSVNDDFDLFSPKADKPKRNTNFDL